MDKIEELLPGLEEFLASTLASEALSSFAEERRQFFLERVDIIKLPPSVPPREGRVLPPDLLEESEKTSGIPVYHHVTDFAATQRAISRSFIESIPVQNDVRDPTDPTLDTEVKVYDDIDYPDSIPDHDYTSQHSASENNLRIASDRTGRDCDGHVLYEIPVSIQQFSAEDTSQSYGTDGSSLATTGSTEELPSWEITTASPRITCPLPPSMDVKAPDPGSQESISEEDKPPELPFRPPLPKRNEIYSRSDRSEQSDTEKSIISDQEHSGDGDSTSYESFDDDEEDQSNNDVTNKFNVQLPKKLNTKSKLKRHRKLRKTRPSYQWEMNVPFGKLENVEISGEFFHRGKISWKRRIGAISSGFLTVYKPEKIARPSLVIPLAGGEVTYSEREGKKGYEVKLVCPDGDSHLLSWEFKDWAVLWLEHIIGNSKGHPPAKYHTHLARSFSESSEYSQHTGTDGIKEDITRAYSNVSTEGGSEENSKDKMRRNKLNRMGSFASRATHFFGNIGKKTERKKSYHESTHGLRHSGHRPASGVRHSSGETAEVVDGNPESSTSSFNSVGNLAKEVLSPASDGSMASVFGTSLSSQPPTPEDIDPPPMTTWEGVSGDNVSDVICKGHLSVFSSFNKRCWGTRWCLVRQNTFQCYKTDHSEQCELSFLLKPCILRRAIAETNSEFGLMILEAGKEKITVEILSRNEMGQWVQVLLRETSTELVPEGLEKFLSQPETNQNQYGSDSKYPYRNMSSHEYEDPEETIAAAARLAICGQTSGATSLSNVDQDDNSEDCQPVLNSNDLNVKSPDKLPLFNKHITDSGFYSVKGNNSDSDISGEDTHDVRNMDFRYGTDGSQSVHNSNNSGSSTVEKCGSNRKSGTGQLVSELPITAKYTKNTSSSFRESHSLPTSEPTRSKNAAFSASKSVFSQQGSQVPTHTRHISNQNKIPTLGNSKKMSLPSRTTYSASTSRKSDSSTSSNQTVISPSGEEYSVILKRSERESSKSCKSRLHDTLPSTTYLESRTSEPIEDDVFCGANNIKQILDEHINSNADTDANPSFYYELDNIQSSLESLTSSTTTMQSAHPEAIVLDGNISQRLLTDSSSDKPPELPRSPVPQLNTDRNNDTRPSCPDTGTVQNDDQSFLAHISKTPETSPTIGTSKALLSEETEQNMMINSEGNNPVTPTSDMVTALIGHPDTTPDELKKVIDSLKSKQAEIKRKRMAVHDKRQRVSSDEERLACEKEFAALEKAGETADQNVRLLQNHLNTLQGQTMDALKAAHGQQKPAPKKKTQRRSQPWR